MDLVGRRETDGCDELVESPVLLVEEHSQIIGSNLSGRVVVVVKDDGGNRNGLCVFPVVLCIETSNGFQATNDRQIIGHTIGSSQHPLLSNDNASAEVLASIRSHYPLQGNHERGGIGHSRGSADNPVIDLIFGRKRYENNLVNIKQGSPTLRLDLHLGMATAAQTRAANTINPLIVVEYLKQNYVAEVVILGYLYRVSARSVLRFISEAAATLIMVYNLITSRPIYRLSNGPMEFRTSSGDTTNRMLIIRCHAAHCRM